MPDIEALRVLANEIQNGGRGSYARAEERLGVTPATIKKWFRKEGIEVPDGFHREKAPHGFVSIQEHLSLVRRRLVAENTSSEEP